MQESKASGLNISVKSFLTAILVILVLMVMTYGLTLVIPGGVYARTTDAAGNTVIDTAAGFTAVEGGLPFWKWLLSPLLVLTAPGSGTLIAVIAFLLVIGGGIQHDVDTTGVGDPIGLVSTVNMVSFPTADFARARAAMDKTGYPYRTGRVATGDWFAIPGERVNFIRETFSPLLCEMEGCAVAQVCHRANVPMMALKSVSDCLVVKQDYYFNFPAAMADLNSAAMAFVDALEG